MRWQPLLALAGGLWGVVIGAGAAALGAAWWFVLLMVGTGVLAIYISAVVLERPSAGPLTRAWWLAGAMYLALSAVGILSIGIFITPAAAMLFTAAALDQRGGVSERPYR